MTNNTVHTNTTHIERSAEDILKELGPQEIDITRKVLTNIRAYSQMYQYITEFILIEYPKIDSNKISKIAGDIDDDLSHIGYGERLFIYNKLDRPFIVDFYERQLKDEIYLKPLWIDEVNTTILSIHQDMDMKHIEKIIRDTEEKLKNLKYEEKWLIYNSLAHILIQDFIGELGK